MNTKNSRFNFKHTIESPKSPKLLQKLKKLLLKPKKPKLPPVYGPMSSKSEMLCVLKNARVGVVDHPGEPEDLEF